MKKNNKFRSNGNSNAYSLNYKFDSVSPAGKINGTALDLIKKYNELAKESHGLGDYIEMEVYRQYAEHYRKIVTEINERKNYRQEQQNQEQQNNEGNSSDIEQNTETCVENVEENIQKEETVVEPIVQKPMLLKKKSFKIVEIKEKDIQDTLPVPEPNTLKEKPNSVEPVTKPKRVVRRKKTDSQESKAV